MPKIEMSVFLEEAADGKAATMETQFFEEEPFTGKIRKPVKRKLKPRKSPKKKSPKSSKDEVDDVSPDNVSESDEQGSPTESMPLFVEQTAIKRDTVFEDVTEEQQLIIQQRLAEHQRRFREYEERQKKQMQTSILGMHPHISTEEVTYALQQFGGDEQEMWSYLQEISNLHTIRKEIAKREMKEAAKKEKERRKNEPQVAAEIPEHTFVKRRKTSGLSKGKKDGTGYVYTHLRLDAALAQGNFDGWSEARMKAYKQKDKNPNAYYYRFNDPGQGQKNGKWTQEERKLFFQRLKEVGVRDKQQWGTFSMTIPGRVGYQCSNFYRLLIQSGEIKDENYILDDKGKARFLYKSKKEKEADGTEGETKGRIIVKKRKNKKGSSKKKDDSDADSDESDDESYKPSGSLGKRSKTELQEEHEKKMAAANPLPDLFDPISMCPVERPAISPYGHVLSYQTWIRCLGQDPKNTCPFTKQPVKKRDLVILTWENIDEYRDQMVELQK